MKNKLSQFALLIIGSCLFFSCSNQFISLQKRHYRDGYNVEYGFKQKDGREQKDEKEKEKEKKKTKYSNTAEQELPVLAETPQQEIQQHQESEVTQNNSDKIEAPQLVPVKKKAVKIKAQQKNITLEKKKAKISHTITKLKKKTKDDDTLENALSLFWIVILLFIMLWFLALLTGGWGLGTLVNILLVIALILLILWLLKVV